jgi:cell division protein FtsB
MDIATIQAGLQGFQTAKDIIKALVDLKEFAAHKGQFIDLTNAVIAAQGATLQFQAENASLIAEKNNLEKEIMRLKTWAAEKQRYELQEVATGVFAYVVKETMRNSEPSHWLCSHCYQENIKSILQSTSEGIHTCFRCRNEIFVSGSGGEVIDPNADTNWMGR